MIDPVFVVAGVVVAFLAWAFAPYIKWALLYALVSIGITPMWGAQVLVFETPRPDSKAQVFTFTGLDVRTRFFGMVRSQEAYLAPADPAEKSRIVMPD